MRPGSIILFERIYLATLALGLLSSILTWDDMAAQLAADPATAGFGTDFVAGVLVVSTAVSVLFWYLIARRASNVARWIWIVLTLLGFAMIGIELAAGTYVLDSSGVWTLIVMALYLIAMVLLLRPDAAAWFAHKGRTVDPEIFD